MTRFHSLLTSFFLLAWSVFPLASASAATYNNLDLTDQGDQFTINGSSEKAYLTGTLTGGADQEIYFTSVRGNFLYMQCTDVSNFKGTLTAGPSTNTTYGTWISLDGSTLDFSNVTFNPNPGKVNDGGANQGKSIDAGILINFDVTNKTLQIGAISGDGVFRTDGAGNNKVVSIQVGAKNIDTEFSGSFPRYSNSNYKIEKVGTGTWTITSDYTTYYSGAPVGTITKNNYTGDTTITEGTIQIGKGGDVGHLGTSTDSSKLTKIIIGEEGTLAINRSGTFTFYNNIESSGTLKIVSADEGEYTTLAGTVTGTINKTGGGTLLVTGDNLSGVTEFTVTEGTLQIGNGGTTGNLGTGTDSSSMTEIIIGEGGTLAINRSDVVQFYNNIESSGTISIVGEVALKGSVSGAFTKTGTGTLAVESGNGDALTEITVKEGTLRNSTADHLGNGATAIVLDGGTFQETTDGVSLGNTFTLNSSSAIDVPENVSATLSGTVSFAENKTGTLTKSGAGTLNLAGTNSLTDGTIEISEGTLAVTDPSQLGGATNITIGQNGTLGITSSADAVYPQTIESAGAIQITSDEAGNYTSLAGTVTGTINKTGDGTLLITGNNFTGVTKFTVTEGKLQFGDGEASSTCAYKSDARSFDVKSGGTLAFKYAIPGSGDLSIYGNITSDGGNIEVSGTGGHLALRGSISGSFVKTGTGNLALGSKNGSALTKITIKEGTLRNYYADRLGDGATEIELNGGSFAGADTHELSNTFTVTANSTISVFSGKTLTLSGSLTTTNGQSINIIGGGTLKLTGTNNLTGSTIAISNGTLAVTDPSKLGSASKITIGQNCTLEITSSTNGVYPQAIESAGTIKITSIAAGDYTSLTGAVTGTINKTGNGVLAVESSNGNALTKITIKEGTLRNSTADHLGNGATEIVLDGGTFQEMNNVTLSNKFTIQSDSTIDIPENITTTISSDIDKVTGQTDIVTKTGKGTLVFTGANEFTGGYIIDEGTFQCGNNDNGHINNSASVTVNSGAAFGYNRAADTSMVKPTNVFTVDGGKLFNSGARAIEFQNVTMQSGGMTLENTGTSTLSAKVKSTDNGVLTFNGTTDGDITANVNGSSAAQTFSGLASANNVKSTINYTSSNRDNHFTLNGSMETFSGDINLSGNTWFKFNSGTALGSEKASFNLAMTKDCGLLFESGDLNGKTIKMGDLTGVGWVRAGNGGSNVTLEVGALGNDSTFSGALINYQGTRGLTVKKVGNGNWTFASDNQKNFTYDNTANVVVDAGTLTLNRKANQPSANDLTVNNGATLVVAGNSQKVSNLVTLNSGSVMDLNVTGANAYASLTAKTLDIKDGSKIEVKFSDSVDPFAIGTLELITADQFKVNGTMVSSDDAMRSLLETYVEVKADWAQISYIPNGETGYTVLLQTDYNAVPEPSAWILALLGFTGLGILKRRFPRR